MRAEQLLASAFLLSCARSPEATTLRQARQGLARLAPESGDLVLQCDPADTMVVLNDVPQGHCSDFAGQPKGLGVGAGGHWVELQREGYWTERRWFDPAGTRGTLTVVLRRKGTNP